jgi:hypothetical protein
MTFLTIIFIIAAVVIQQINFSIINDELNGILEKLNEKDTDEQEKHIDVQG